MDIEQEANLAESTYLLFQGFALALPRLSHADGSTI